MLRKPLKTQNGGLKWEAANYKNNERTMFLPTYSREKKLLVINFEETYIVHAISRAFADVFGYCKHPYSFFPCHHVKS